MMLVVISNMLKRYSFQIPVLYVQQLYSCCYLERLLIIGLILSCRCYCFYYRSDWFNRLLLLCDLFLVLLLLFVYVIGSVFQFQILRFVSLFRTVVSDLSCYSHVVRVQWVISGSNRSFHFDPSFRFFVRLSRTLSGCVTICFRFRFRRVSS